MDAIIYNQLYSTFIFALVGAIIGLLFDVFRILRKTFKTPDIITFLEDIIFWILVGVIILVSIFKFNYGELRSYIFIGMIAGFTIYILIISPYLIKISVRILATIKNIISFPFKKIYNFWQKM